MKFFRWLSMSLVVMLTVLVGVPVMNTVVQAQEDNEPYIIATDTTFAPFEYQDENGDFVGIDMDLLEAIAEDQGFEYEIRPLGFNAALQAVESGQVDGMIAGMGITEERQESFDFSDPYYEAGVQFAVLEDSDIESLEDLEGENVAVKTGTTGMAAAESVADEYGFTISTFEDSVNMYEDLQAGNSAAVIEDYPVMAYAAQTGGIPLRFIGEQMEVTDYGFAVSAGENPELIEMFNAGLESVRESGEFDEIIDTHLGETDLAESESDSEEEESSQESEAAVVADPDRTYIIGTDTTFAPFEYQDENGDFVGIDMDLLEAIAADQGFEYEIRPLGFNAALQAVEAGQIDGMIAGMGITEERQESFDFSEPYFEAGVQFAVLEDSDIESLEDLEGQNVAVKTGTTGMAAAESVADEYGFTISTFEDSVNLYEDLQAGNSAAVIEDYPVMAYAAQTGGIPLRFIGEQMEVTDYGFAVQTGENPELIEMFNAGLSNVRESGEFDEIVNTHLGDTDMANADPSSEGEEGSEEAEEVVADPDRTYVIGTDTTFAPFEFVGDDGEYVGIDMDLLAAIALDQGFNYEIRPLGFNAALQAVEAGQIDGMIAGMGITEEREESFDFSNPYYEAGVQFAVLEDSDVESLEDLEGQNVAVKTGTTGMAAAESVADEYGFTISTFEDSVNMYEDLQAGNSVAVIEDYPVMAYAAQTGGIPLRFIGEQMEVTDYGFAVSEGQNPELVGLFNQGLSNIQASGEYDTIISNYLGEEELEEESSSSGFFGLIEQNGRALLNGLWTTLWITLVSFAIAAVIGIIIGLMRTSGNIILSFIAQVYIDLMRGTPMIVLSFFVYFGIPQLTGWTFGAVAAGITTLSINAAAYIAEIVRGGINAVDVGQNEAARSLGLNKGKTMRRIILPQAFRIMIPSFINQFVITLKDTSILSVIGLVELTQTGRIIIARTYQSGAMWLIVGLMYIILITILTKISNRLEKDV